MNTIDKSTEDIDDALFVRIASVEFPRGSKIWLPPRCKEARFVVSEKIRQLYPAILEVYPLGHGYFAGLTHPLIYFLLFDPYPASLVQYLLSFNHKN